MIARLAATVLIAALAVPSPAPLPLRTITHIRVLRLCTALERSVYPAVGHILQDDGVIAQSRPLFREYVKQSAAGTRAAVDLDIMRLEGLIAPLVKNTQAVDALLNDPIYTGSAPSKTNAQLLAMRTQLEEVLAKQKKALDLISGFADTQQLGELQQEGRGANAIIGSDRASALPPQSAPSPPPNEVLNAGLGSNEVQRKYDPRYTTTNSLEGYNPLNTFDQQMYLYQQTITASENAASKAILAVVPECGGKVPGPGK